LPHFKAEAKERQEAGKANLMRGAAPGHARNGMTGENLGPAREHAARVVGVSC